MDRRNIPMVEVHCAYCGCEFSVPADDECLIAWEGCFCCEECELRKFGMWDDDADDIDNGEIDELVR